MVAYILTERESPYIVTLRKQKYSHIDINKANICKYNKLAE